VNNKTSKKDLMIGDTVRCQLYNSSGPLHTDISSPKSDTSLTYCIESKEELILDK
jgi:hypothetical protein